MNRACIYIVLLLAFSSLNASCKSKATALPEEPTIPESPELLPLPAALYSYKSGTSAYFNVYQKLSEEDSLYTQFKIYHQHSTVRNDNLWRVLEGNLVKYNGSVMTPVQKILANGENEFVWKSARPHVGDFTGGYHGDERIDVDASSSIAFYADEKVISHTGGDIALTPCTSFYYHQFSTMHQTGTGATDQSKPGYVAIPDNPIECYHEKKTTFENNGYTTYNKLSWLNETPIDRCYFGIICVSTDISFEGTNEDGATVVFNSDGGNKLTSTKHKIKMRNEDSTISIVCDAKIISAPFASDLSTFIWDNQNYHKYYSMLKTPKTSPGDVWETSASISFSYIK